MTAQCIAAVSDLLHFGRVLDVDKLDIVSVLCFYAVFALYHLSVGLSSDRMVIFKSALQGYPANTCSFGIRCYFGLVYHAVGVVLVQLVRLIHLYQRTHLDLELLACVLYKTRIVV